MGQTPEEIEKEIEQTREALGEKVDVLASQVKDGVEIAREKGLKIAGALFAVVVTFLAWRKMRSR